MRLPRWMHRAYARFFGYFWIPCPLCGYMRGGHEIRDDDAYIHDDDSGIGHGVCQREACQAIARASEDAFNIRRYGGVLRRVPR